MARGDGRDQRNASRDVGARGSTGGGSLGGGMGGSNRGGLARSLLGGVGGFYGATGAPGSFYSNQPPAAMQHGSFGTGLGMPSPMAPMRPAMPSGYDPNSRSAAFNTPMNLNNPGRMHAPDLSMNPLTTSHTNELRHLGMSIMTAGDPTGLLGTAYGIGDALTPDRQVPSAGQARPGFQTSSVPVAPQQGQQPRNLAERLLSGLFGAAPAMRGLIR